MRSKLAARVVGGVALGAWLYLLLGRGGFWRTRERDDQHEPAAEPSCWPAVVAVVPARDEADVIARSIGSLLAQDYPGPFRVILVDDESGDATSAVARALPGAPERLTVVAGAPRPLGWTGKLWALSQGVAQGSADLPEYLLLTDADIGHAPDNLRRLVSRAEAGRLALVSQMARLHCESPAELLLIPAFVFFFDMLYPFAWVNDPRRRTAAAAGGCMLVRHEALEAAGGIAAIRGEIIDDCALGRAMKAQGPIWLGLTNRAVSLRPYAGVGEIGRMVSRSAYAQLGYSPGRLVGTVAGMGVLYAAPPLLTLFGRGFARWSGAAAWALMALASQPMLRFYRASPLWGVGLPVVGAAYTGFTVQSAVQVWQGRGGQWKGRAQARLEGSAVSGAAALQSGKDHTAENFPVASALIAPRHRRSILAFYRFARAADDVADHPTASADEKLALLESLRATLAGQSDDYPEALGLRRAVADRPALARHGLDLLEAFRRDVAKTRYADWAELMDYCRWSAMPVGRFVLDVHGESAATWPASDALCAALQVVNHLQDCGKDYRTIDRVYVPLDALAAAGIGVEALGEDRASPALRGVIAGMARRTEALLSQSRPFAGQVRDLRLALEVGVIQSLGEDLNARLLRRDPLSQRVHHRKPEALGLALAAAVGVLARRGRPIQTPASPDDDASPVRR